MNPSTPCSPGVRREPYPLLWSPSFHYINKEFAPISLCVPCRIPISSSPPTLTTSQSLSAFMSLGPSLYTLYLCLLQSPKEIQKSQVSNLHITLQIIFWPLFSTPHNLLNFFYVVYWSLQSITRKTTYILNFFSEYSFYFFFFFFQIYIPNL